jgi:hypothetical protein
VSEREVDAKAFNTCKGIAIIIGGEWGGRVSFGLYNMHGSRVSRVQTYPEIYTHACFLVSTHSPMHTKQHYWMNLLC